MIIPRKKLSERILEVLDERFIADSTKNALDAMVSFTEDELKDKLNAMLVIIRQMNHSESCDGIIEGYALVLYDMVFQTLNALGMANMKTPYPPKEIDSDAKKTKPYRHIATPLKRRREPFLDVLGAWRETNNKQEKQPMEQNNGLNKVIRQFKDCLCKGNQYIEQACKLYVAQIDIDEKRKYAFQEQCPEVPKNAWKHFEMVGRGTLDINVMFSGSNCVQTLSRLPISAQKEIVKNGVNVFDGKKMRKVPISAIDINVARQAIAPDGHIRTEDEQAVYVKSHTRRKAKKTTDYEIRGNKVMFLQPRLYTKKELMKIVEQLA